MIRSSYKYEIIVLISQNADPDADTAHKAEVSYETIIGQARILTGIRTVLTLQAQQDGSDIAIFTATKLSPPNPSVFFYNPVTFAGSDERNTRTLIFDELVFLGNVARISIFFGKYCFCGDIQATG